MPPQMIRASSGFLPNSQQQRLMQQGQNSMSSSWPVQQQQQLQASQDLWSARQPCYIPQGKFSCSQPQQQHSFMANSSYATSAFPSRYSSPQNPSSVASGGLSRVPAAQQRIPVSPRPPPPPFALQNQQPPLMLSQLLVQPHSQQQQQQRLMHDGTLQSQNSIPPPPPQQQTPR